MSFYPDVNPGQNFEPSAQLENDVRRLVNRGGLSGVRANGGGVQVENICINAVNPGSEAIPSGACIVFPSGAMVEGCVPVEKISDLTEKTWGIAMDEIPSSQFGSVLVMGAAVVNVSGGSGDYIVPTSSDGVFTRSDSGSAKVLREITDGAIVLVGVTPPGSGSAPAPSSGYDGPFKVEFLSRTSAGDLVVSVHGGRIIGENMCPYQVSGGIISFPYNSLGLGEIYAAGSHMIDATLNGWYDHYNVEFYGGRTLPSKYSITSGYGTNVQMFAVEIARLYVPSNSHSPVSVTQKQITDIHFTQWGKEWPGDGIGLSSDRKQFQLKPGDEISQGGAVILDDISPYGNYGYRSGIVPSVAAMMRFVEHEIYNLATANDLSYSYIPQSSYPSSSATITPSTTAPTNGSVTLTASFSADTTVKKYRMAYGDTTDSDQYVILPTSWNNYTSPVVFSSNGIFEVMAQKAQDGIPLFTRYVVKNIDKNPPKKPRVTVDKISLTSQVRVTADFAWAVSSHYKIDNGDWTAYNGAVVMTSNGKITFRAIDYAGNSSTEYYVVENIESSGS